MRQLNSDQSWIKELERSMASMAVGSGLRSQVHQKKSRQRNITCCRIGYKIGCMHGRSWFMMKIPATTATTSMQLLPTHKYIKKRFICLDCLDCSLYVANAIEISRSWQKQACLKLSDSHPLCKLIRNGSR